MKDSQFQMKDIQFDKIKQKEVKNLIEKQMKSGVLTFDDLRETYTFGEDLSTHSTHERSYLVETPVADIWDHYMTANPSEVWNGSMISFGLLVGGASKEIVYPQDDYNGASIGQVLYVNLNVFGGLIKLAVTHKIIDIDPVKKNMTFSYVEGGKSIGKQQIQFTAEPDGSTKITHLTFYKSDSVFREKCLYPYFHTKAIDEYHANMQNSFKS